MSELSPDSVMKVKPGLMTAMDKRNSLNLFASGHAFKSMAVGNVS